MPERYDRYIARALNALDVAHDDATSREAQAICLMEAQMFAQLATADALHRIALAKGAH